MPHARRSLGRSFGCHRAGPLPRETWNVLASVHTGWNASAHGGPAKTQESEAQRQTRYGRVATAINREQPDVLLLQEVDERFLPRDWQRGKGPLPCGVELRGYTPYRSYSPSRGGVLEGVAILLRHGVFEKDVSLPREVAACRLPKCDRRGGKEALVVHARCCHDHTQRVVFCTVHLRWGDPEPKLNVIVDTLEAAAAGSTTPCVVVLGGDFNTRLEHMAPLDAALGASGLVRCPADGSLPTAMGADPWTGEFFVFCL